MLLSFSRGHFPHGSAEDPKSWLPALSSDLEPPLLQGLRALGGGAGSVFRMAKLSIRRIDFWQVGGYPTARDRKTVRLATAQSPSSRIGHQMSQVDVAQAPENQNASDATCCPPCNADFGQAVAGRVVRQCNILD